MLCEIVATLLTLIFPVWALDPPTAATPRPQPTSILYTSTPEYSPMAWISGGERFPKGATVVLVRGIMRQPLVPQFAASADANVSFDAKSVLISAKEKPSDHWQIWDFSLENNKPRQLTHCNDDCVRPFYVPPDCFVYAHRIAGEFVLEIASLAAQEKPLRLTYVPGSSLPTDVLLDGRVLFEATHPLGENNSIELYTVYSDGSGIESYRCDHGHARHSGKQIPSGNIVLVSDKGLARFTSRFAHEVEVSVPAGDYAGDIIQASGGEWLVSWRANPQKHFELRNWKPGTRLMQPAFAEPVADVVQPALVAPRPIPNRHPSGLHDWPYANVLCLNAYTSKDHFAAGSISSVRLYTRGAAGTPQLLGSAPVENDGSFYLRVPGDKPLQIELLDSSGKTLKKEAGWFWMRAGEQRVCVGCHAGPETAPENAVPAVLRRSIVPADMTAGHQPSSAGGH